MVLCVLINEERRKIMAEIIVIPPRKAAEQNNQKLRTAAYARVSSDSEDQQNSFLTQMDYYKQYISKNPEMEFC